jgi:hypothetical protein
MFGFIHPRPPSRKEVAMQIVQQEARRLNPTELTVDLPDGPVAAPTPSDAPIRFEVAYTVGEYRSFVRDHLAFLARRDAPGARRAKWLWPIGFAAAAALLAWLAGPGWLRGVSIAASALALAWVPAMTGFWVALIATPIFYVKKRRMPLCAFDIDADGIARTTRAGRLVRRWDEVKAVRRYRQGYLVFMERGAMPIPLRCMTAAQQERFRALVLGRGGRNTPTPAPVPA